MKTVAVLGGGPAGSFAAERLARAGLRTLVFDEKLAWEKPCGGGLTYKAYNTYPFLIENSTPKKVVTNTTLAAPRAGSVSMALAQPLLIYSRFDLNRMLLERAERAGAEIEKARVLEVNREGRGWALKTRSGTAKADFCVVATGARNSLRNVGTEWTRSDTMYALGYYVPTNQDHIDIQFLPNLEGYIWVFPRCGHLSVGICGKGESAQSLRARLERYMAEKSISTRDAQFYGHVLPSLETASFRRNRIAGDGWLAVGDAGGDKACAAELLGKERLARDGKLGLWGAAYYAVTGAESLAELEAERGRFTVVEGKVLSVRESGGTIYINFGRRWSQALTVTILKRNERTFAAAGLDLRKLENRRVRVRGWVEERSGPRIEATRPEQVEIAERN